MLARQRYTAPAVRLRDLSDAESRGERACGPSRPGCARGGLEYRARRRATRSEHGPRPHLIPAEAGRRQVGVSARAAASLHRAPRWRRTRYWPRRSAARWGWLPWPPCTQPGSSTSRAV